MPSIDEFIGETEMSMSLSNALQDQFFAAMLGLGIAIGMTPAASASERIDMHAAAAMGSVTRTTLVRVADLNLGDPTAAKTLETRLKVAAGKVCAKDSLWTLRPPAD